MRILALNCGSSSIKAAVIDSADGHRVVEARIESIGAEYSELHVGDRARRVCATDHAAGVEALIGEMHSAGAAAQRIDAVAHRMVHGGDRFVAPTLVNDEVLASLETLVELAPLHNPPALAVLRRARTALAEVPHVLVFDTAFHSKLPPHAREYALPGEIRRQYGFRRYGFHGISHQHVMMSVAEHYCTRPDSLRVISCHLGAGASVAAIENGRSVDTSMGMTPLEGLVMASRVGDVDAGIILQLVRTGLNVDQLDELLNRRSGLVGLTGVSDMRAVQGRAEAGDQACNLAIALYSHRVRKYIGAYAATMGGVDVIAFAAGVGENSAMIRQRCTQNLEFLGAVLDEHRNQAVRFNATTPVVDISEERSQVRILVIRADEERSMAREAATLLGPGSGSPALGPTATKS
jgi:acetate kinase